MLRGLLLAAVGCLAAGGLAGAADPSPLTGKWKLSLPAKDGEVVLILGFNEKDGAWSGEYLASSAKLPGQLKFKALKVNGDVAQFTLEIQGEELVNFDGALSKDKKKIAGSMMIGGTSLLLTELYPTKLKDLDDPVAVARETLTQVEGGMSLFEACLEIVSNAAAKKVPADEVRAVLDRANKAAAVYGPRWERDTTLRLADTLAPQDGYADIAVAQAKRAERLLTDDDDVATRMSVLQAVVNALTRAGKANEAKPYQAQVAKLETRDYADYVKTFPFKTEAFAGRKAKSDRAVLVEAFTSTEFPPSVPTDLAFDGLMKTYKPAEVVLLHYHLHIRVPDPLTSPDSLKRAETYYRGQFDGAPPVLFNGKVGPQADGPRATAKEVYEGYCKTIDQGLEKPAGAKLTVSITKGEKDAYTAKATVSDLESPGEKVMLRFALAEERVRYVGGNGLRYHHMIVRSMPGGVNGFPLAKKSVEQTVTFNPEELRKELGKYLADIAKDDPLSRPLALKNLKLVAFVQNDATKEVLQAVQVDVE